MLKSLIATALLTVSAFAAATPQDDVVNVEKFQPAIVTTQAPDLPNGWNLKKWIKRTGLAEFTANVPTYNGKGNLISSWNPRPAHERFDRPTFIIVHGGHGLEFTSMDMGIQLIDKLNANVLILDSYWSRGKTENWTAWTEMGANMRMLDAIAAARFAKSQGTDPKKTFLVGGSQGGWTVLRTFSDHNLTGEVNSLFVGGVSLYPNCYAKESKWFGAAPNGARDVDMAPPLGNYTAPVIAFTGSEDQATPLSQCNVDKVLKTTEKWINFPGATHAWDVPTEGPGNQSIDGKCTKALNRYNQFAICRSDEYTGITYHEMFAFVKKHSAPFTGAE